MALTNRTERLVNEILIPAITNLGGTIPQRTPITNLEEYQFTLMSQFVNSLLNTLTQAAFTAHTSNVNNPHVTTALQVGAEVSGAVATHAAVAAPHSGHATTTALTAHTSNTNNPHNTTALQVGAEVSGAVATHAAVAAPHSGHATTTALTAHTSNTNNPHNTTAAMAGAATATQGANADSHAARTDNPHGTTAAMTGAPTTAVLTAHTSAAANVHGLPANVNVLGNRNAAGQFVQSGTAVASGAATTLALAQYRQIAITFPVAFTAAPLIFVNDINGHPACVTAVSASGCTIRVFGEMSFAATDTVHYLAIGA